MKPKKTYLYARVSSEDQNLEGQWDQLNHWANGNANYTVIALGDKGSGRNMQRKGMQTILRAVESGEAGEIAVVSINRLGRNTRQVCEVIELCQRKGVKIVSLREGIDTETPFGKLLAVILAAIAELENEQRSDATRAGIEAKRKACERNGEVFVHGGSTKGYSTAVSEEKALAIQALHSQGKSYRKIAMAVGLSDKTVRQVILHPRPTYVSRTEQAQQRRFGTAS